MSDIKKIMEAYNNMVSEKKMMCEKCGKMHEGECEMDDDENEMDEAKKLDPVDDAENDKPFAKRKDKDIDNDGDVDSSDEYLHKKRAATDDAIDGGKKPADNASKKKKPTSGNDGKKTAEISKIESVTTKEAKESPVYHIVTQGEGDNKQKVVGVYDDVKKATAARDAWNKKNNPAKPSHRARVYSQKPYWNNEKPKVGSAISWSTYSNKDNYTKIKESTEIDVSESFESLWTAIEEAVNQKKGASEPEKMDSKASPKEKEFVAKHAVDAVSHDELEKIEEPKERKVKKEMKEFEVIRALLSGKPLDGE